MNEADRIEALMAMKFGPREYTAEQYEFIDRVVRDRKPLPGTPLPIESDGP